jgi:hypothetical protein
VFVPKSSPVAALVLRWMPVFSVRAMDDPGGRTHVNAVFRRQIASNQKKSIWV